MANQLILGSRSGNPPSGWRKGGKEETRKERDWAENGGRQVMGVWETRFQRFTWRTGWGKPPSDRRDPWPRTKRTPGWRRRTAAASGTGSCGGERERKCSKSNTLCKTKAMYKQYRRAGTVSNEQQPSSHVGHSKNGERKYCKNNGVLKINKGGNCSSRYGWIRNV